MLKWILKEKVMMQGGVQGSVGSRCAKGMGLSGSITLFYRVNMFVFIVS
jgi:hypothetical protein